MNGPSLVVNEIYRSIQGESSWAGWPCIFIRTTGCNLRCSYCDTAYAFTRGNRTSLDDILLRVQALADPRPFPIDTPPTTPPSPTPRLPLVELTGGEPLLQPATLPLMNRLADLGFTVLLETSGALDIAPVDPRVRRIVDLKCPSSGESERNFWPNIQQLKPTDELKFVIGALEDYTWAVDTLRKHNLPDLCPILFSWVAPLLPPQQDPSLKTVPAGLHPISRLQLVERIIADALPVRFQLQMHKFIWPPDQKGV